MSATESSISKHYRLEVRRGTMGWRWHARGPNGIEATAQLPHASREEALEEGREVLRASGLDSWSEWVDGVTDNHYDPRADRKMVVDTVEEAKRAGLEAPDPEKQAEATKKLRELEDRRSKATEEARERVIKQSPDVGMGVDNLPEREPTSPLTAQQKKAEKAKEAAEK